jgi:hypothetical protein
MELLHHAFAQLLASLFFTRLAGRGFDLRVHFRIFAEGLRFIRCIGFWFGGSATLGIFGVGSFDGHFGSEIIDWWSGVNYDTYENTGPECAQYGIVSSLAHSNSRAVCATVKISFSPVFSFAFSTSSSGDCATYPIAADSQSAQDAVDAKLVRRCRPGQARERQSF